MKYRKKPVIIEAFKWQPNAPAGETPEWFYKACEDRIIFPEFRGTVIIKTLEGNHCCQIGDYIIQGVKGELYPCKPDIFEMTYEEVNEEIK